MTTDIRRALQVLRVIGWFEFYECVFASNRAKSSPNPTSYFNSRDRIPLGTGLGGPSDVGVDSTGGKEPYERYKNPNRGY